MSLCSTSAEVRGQGCQLLGNLCRNSAYFYAAAVEEGVAPVVAALCGDQGQSGRGGTGGEGVEEGGISAASVRKNALYAVGNLAFHSSLMYRQLAAALPLALKLLGFVK